MKYFNALFVVILLLSCKPAVRGVLESAESLIDERPDSALVLLNGIERSSLRGEAMIARYALLKSMALDKSYIDIQSDSIIRPAVEYYAVHGPRHKKMLAWYYQAVVLDNQGDYPAAIVSLEKAEKEALQEGDNYYLGLIYRKESTIFNGLANMPAAIQLGEKAINAFQRAGKDVHAAFAMLSLGISWYNSSEYGKARHYLQEAMQASNNPALQERCRLRLAAIDLLEGGSPTDAIVVFRSIPEKYYDLYHYGYYAIAMDRIHQADSCDYWLNKGYAHAYNQADTASLDYMKSRIELWRGNYQTAFIYLDNASKVQEAHTQAVLQESLNTALKNYYKESLELEERTRKHERLKQALAGILGMVTFILVVIWLTLRLKRRKQELELQMARFHAVQQEKQGVMEQKALLLGDLFSERIHHLDQLSSEYFSAEDKRKKEIVLETFKRYLDECRNNEVVFKSLETDLDCYYDGIMGKLRTQVPRIKGEKLKIAMLFFAGVPYETIQLVMRSVSVESLRTLRSRLKKEVIAAQAPDSALFLAMLDNKKAAGGQKNR